MILFKLLGVGILMCTHHTYDDSSLYTCITYISVYLRVIWGNVNINLDVSDKVSIWIVGSSIVKRAGIAARTRQGGKKLNLPNASVWWQGYGGMKLHDLIPKLKSLQKYEDKPNIIIIHCGANNIGHIPIKRLLHLLRNTLEEVVNMFPQTKIIWSCTLPRHSWRFSNKVRAMEKARCRLDRAAIAYITSQRGSFIKHSQFNTKPTQLFEADGVHLSPLGNDIFLNNIQRVIQELSC